MKKQMLVLAVVVLMVFASIVPALADDGTGTLVLTGGSLSVSPAAITFAAFTLDGVAHPNVAGTTSAWSAVDATGSGAGWHMTVVATVPTNGASKTIPLSGLEMTLLDTAIAVVDGNTKPISSDFATATALTASAQNLASAALGEGMGSYTLQPTFTLDVPANTYAGTYNTTITVQMVTAPAS